MAAPVLLIVFRLLQGTSFGAEFGTASTWVVEQAAKSKYRAFWGAFAIPIGLLLGFGSVIFVKSLMTHAEFIGFGFVFGFGYGAIPTFYTENFPTRYRASGANAAYQIAQVYGGGLIPILAGLILQAAGIHRAYIYIGLLVMVYAILAIIAILMTPDTKAVDLEE